MALTNKLTYIADAIRSKTGKTAELSLEEIEATIRGSLAVNPTPSYIAAEAQRVAGLINPANFNIASGADIHLYSGNSAHDKSLVSAQYAGMGIKELQKRTSIDAVVLCGDYSYMSSSSYTAEQTERDIVLSEKALDIEGEKILCLGNHDWTYGKGVDRMFTPDEVYNLVGSKSDGVKPTGDDLNRCYGYLDFEEHKIRVIYLNTNDCKDGIANGGVTKDSYGYLEFISPTQFRWVADVALKFTESGWGVVFVSHHPLDYAFVWFTKFMQMLEAYNNGTSVTLYLAEYIKDGTTVGHNETFNFKNMANRAEIICNIHGHNHNCAFALISSSTAGSAPTTGIEPWLWRFCVPNMCANRYNESATVESRKYMGEFDESGNPVYWTKETGNAKATSFNVISIDRTNKMIYAYIFGAGKDRVMYYGEYIPVEYTIAVNATNCVASSSNPTTITEGLSASLVFTASNGYELPDSVTVSGAEYTWSKSTGTLTLSNPTANVSVTIAGVEVVLPYINQIPISTGVDGSIYNGVGYKEKCKMNTNTGLEETNNSYDSTGFIPIGIGSANTARGEQVARLQDLTIPATTSTRIFFYKADKSFVSKGVKYGSQFLLLSEDNQTTVDIVYDLDENANIKYLDFTGFTSYQHNTGNDIAFIRISCPNIDGNSIITVNEEIV